MGSVIQTCLIASLCCFPTNRAVRLGHGVLVCITTATTHSTHCADTDTGTLSGGVKKGDCTSEEEARKEREKKEAIAQEHKIRGRLLAKFVEEARIEAEKLRISEKENKS